ncbi:MAG: hypothetical protein P1V81_05315 [Planctomycetota bacterium]|nr:hypothetical protein [Planctomycetota bacterium]
MIALLWVALITWLTGTRLLTLFGLDARDDRLGWFGWSIMGGSLASSLLLFLLFWALPGQLDAVAVMLAQAVVALLLGLLARKRRRRLVPAVVEPSRTPSLLFRSAVALAIAFSVLRILDGNLVPALAGDEAMLWGYRARVIVSEGGLGADYLAAMASPALRHEDYPLCGSLLQSWVLLLDGPGDMVGLRLPLQLLALGLVTSLAAALRRHTEPLVGAALLLGFAALPHTRGALQSAGAEAPVALGLLVAADGWLRFERDGRRAWLGLASLGMALALFTKNDAALFTATLAAGVALARLFGSGRRLPVPTLACLALIPIGVVALQQSFNRWAGFHNDLMTGKGSGEGLFTRLVDQAPSYLPTTAAFFGDELLTHPRYDGLVFGLLILAGAAALVRWASGPRTKLDVPTPRAGFTPRPWQHAPLALTSASLAALFGLFLVYVATPQPLVWHLQSSAPRVAWQLLPLAYLALAVHVADASRPRPEGRP